MDEISILLQVEVPYRSVLLRRLFVRFLAVLGECSAPAPFPCSAWYDYSLEDILRKVFPFEMSFVLVLDPRPRIGSRVSPLGRHCLSLPRWRTFSSSSPLPPPNPGESKQARSRNGLCDAVSRCHRR